MGGLLAGAIASAWGAPPALVAMGGLAALSSVAIVFAAPHARSIR